MSDPTAAALEQINAIAERFEDAWESGERPRIASYLDGEPGSIQAELVRHLLRVDLERRRERGEAPEPADYEAQLPEWAGMIGDVFAEGPESSRTRTPHFSSGMRPMLEFDEAPPALPGFEVRAELGRGGMGVVYRAWQVSLGRFVALKAIKPGGSGERFRREARLIAQVNSPHVVGVHDLHTLPDGRLVLVMEYVEGTDLARLLISGRES
jgi:serine/threonine-protein kinase